MTIADAGPGPSETHIETRPWLRLAVVAVLGVAMLYGAFFLYQIAQPLFGAILLAVATGFVVVFGVNRFYGARFIFPGVAAVLVFIAFPVAYMIWLGFTNYSSFNLLSYERTIEVLTSRGTVDPETEQPFAVARDGDGYRIWLPES